METEIKIITDKKIIITVSQLEIFFGVKFIGFFVDILFPVSVGSDG